MKILDNTGNGGCHSIFKGIRTFIFLIITLPFVNTSILKSSISTLELSPDSLTGFVFCVLPIVKCKQSLSTGDSLHCVFASWGWGRQLSQKHLQSYYFLDLVGWSVFCVLFCKLRLTIIATCKTLATLSLSCTWGSVCVLCFFANWSQLSLPIENTGNTITITDWLIAPVKHKIRLGLVVGIRQIWTKRLIKETRDQRKERNNVLAFCVCGRLILPLSVRLSFLFLDWFQLCVYQFMCSGFVFLNVWFWLSFASGRQINCDLPW